MPVFKVYPLEISDLGRLHRIKGGLHPLSEGAVLACDDTSSSGNPDDFFVAFSEAGERVAPSSVWYATERISGESPARLLSIQQVGPGASLLVRARIEPDDPYLEVASSDGAFFGLLAPSSPRPEEASPPSSLFVGFGFFGLPAQLNAVLNNSAVALQLPAGFEWTSTHLYEIKLLPGLALLFVDEVLRALLVQSERNFTLTAAPLPVVGQRVFPHAGCPYLRVSGAVSVVALRAGWRDISILHKGEIGAHSLPLLVEGEVDTEWVGYSPAAAGVASQPVPSAGETTFFISSAQGGTFYIDAYLDGDWREIQSASVAAGAVVATEPPSPSNRAKLLRARYVPALTPDTINVASCISKL